MKKFNEKNPKFQCFNCGGIFEASEWNAKTNEIYEENIAKLPEDYIENSLHMINMGLEESNPDLPSFKCPVCEAGPMADELIYIPDGPKVVIQLARLMCDEEEFFECDIDIIEEVKPLHKMLENPIRDYFDYIENISFFDNAKERLETLNVELVISYIKESHPELLKYIEGRGLFLYPAWIPYNALSI